jgi:tetratricopeptide (TPR) repeat protein
VDYLARFEPGPNDPCVCGSARKFKRCCRNHYGVGDTDLTSKKYNERKYAEALQACRSHLTWYIFCHRAHTVPVLKGRSAFAAELLEVDIGALSSLVDMLLSCYRKTSTSNTFPDALNSLSSAIDHPRWREKIVYFKALWVYAERDDAEAARSELSVLDIDRINDPEILALYLDIYNETLGFEERIRLFDRTVAVSSDPAYKLQYSAAKGIAFCLIGELKKGAELLRASIDQYRSVDPKLRSNYGEVLLARSVFALAEVSSDKDAAREALSLYTALRASAPHEHFTPAYFADLAKSLGDCHSFLGIYTEAILHYEESLRIDQSDLTTLFLARAHANCHGISRARDLLNSIPVENLSKPNRYDYAISWSLVATISLEVPDLERAKSELKATGSSSPIFAQQRDAILIELLELRPKEPGGRANRLLAALNRYVSLNPNLFGIGINLNKIVEDLQNVKRRS